MSVKVMGRVFELNLNHAQQSVALALADRAEHDGSGIYPSLARVAWMTGYSRRQTSRIITDLVALGLLVLVAEERDHHPREYRMDTEAVAEKPPYRAAGQFVPPPLPAGQIEPTAGTFGADRQDIAMAHKPSLIEPSIEPSIEAEAKRLYAAALPILRGPLGLAAGIPQPKETPGPGVIRAAKKALAEQSFEVCLRAVSGALRSWAARGVRGQSFTAVFSTGPGTSDLHSRIAYFASQADDIANSDKLQSTPLFDRDNAISMIVGGILYPESDRHQAEAAKAEAQINAQGFVVVRQNTGGFTIERNPNGTSS